MKTTLVITMALLATLSSQNVEARGVAREGVTASKGSGSNIGGGNNGSEYLATWCRTQSSTLRNYRDRSRLKLENSGSYNMANKILADGIVAALDNGSTATESFLHKSLVRGVTIINQLGATNGSVPERKAMATNHILNSYYDLMIETIGQNLDLNGHIPYLSAARDEMDKKTNQFEESFVTYAHTQLNWINRNFVKEVRLGDKLQIAPVGDARSVIKIALTLASATSLDLEDSLWAYRFSCQISDLKMLTQTLKAYDQGNKEMFEDEKQALGYASIEIKRIAHSIESRQVCQ